MALLKRFFTASCLITGCLLLAGFARADESALVEAVLDRFHQAAARADSVSYFAAMTGDAVFLGTDSSERWQGGEFRDFVESHFSAGRGWTYMPAQRSVTVSADGRTAWFDELLENEGLGICRGSGVLVKSAAGWRIAQYNLSVPIPNAIVGRVATEIAALSTAPAPAGTAAPDRTAAPPAAEPPPTSATAQRDEECSRKRFKTNTRAGCPR